MGNKHVHKNLGEIEGTIFPSGRCTKIIVSPQGPLIAKGFCVGRTVIFPNGSIPEHSHENEEVYHILSGMGFMQLGDDTLQVKPGDTIYISPLVKHKLSNDSTEEMEVIWVYAPATIVAHWKDELEGRIR
jgi:mannose-6-phosphate isomerase-like protein (cupin superfamily)